MNDKKFNINPRDLDKLSKHLNRPLEVQKDADDYNMSLVSTILDRTTILFMKAGQKTIQAGDIIKTDSKILAEIKNSSESVSNK